MGLWNEAAKQRFNPPFSEKRTKQCRRNERSSAEGLWAGPIELTEKKKVRGATHIRRWRRQKRSSRFSRGISSSPFQMGRWRVAGARLSLFIADGNSSSPRSCWTSVLEKKPTSLEDPQIKDPILQRTHGRSNVDTGPLNETELNNLTERPCSELMV